MKTKFLLFFSFSFFLMNGQITNLQKLSKGKFYDSDVIKDVNNNIKGYFLLFETDKVDKETYTLEYVVLDENLTKVTSGFMKEMKFESMLVDASRISLDVTLYENKLLIKIVDDINDDFFFDYYKRYRILDIQANKMSDIFTFKNGKIDLSPTIDRKMKNAFNQCESIFYYNELGMFVDSRDVDKEREDRVRYLARLNDDFKEVWKCVYDDGANKKKFKDVKYLNSDKDIIILFNRFRKNSSNPYAFNEYSLLLIDAKTGKLLNEFLLPDMDQFAYSIVDCQIKENEVKILGNYSKKSDHGSIDYSENIGLFNFNFNKTDGKIIDSKFIKWENIGEKLNVDKKGFVKNEGRIFIHNMLSLSEDKTIVVCETFLSSPITTNNMYFLELSKDFKLNQVFAVAKFKNKFPETSAYATDIKKYGLFDFMDYQNLGDDEFLFLFNDNERKSKNRNNSTLYGIVSYSEGKFTRQTLNLKTETSSIKAYPAKKGYVMLVENFDSKDKPSELRLEKINY